MTAFMSPKPACTLAEIRKPPTVLNRHRTRTMPTHTSLDSPNFDVVCLASWNADLVSRVARPPQRGETVLAHGFSIGPGGKGSNAAVAAARQGARVAVIARIGCDDFGRMALVLWAREGIDTRAVEQAEGEPSGVAQIWVYDDGDNSIAVAPGAGAGLGLMQVRAAADLIRAAKVVMAPNEVPAAATGEAFAIARAAGVTTLLNPAPARALPHGLISQCDVVTPNQSELRALAAASEGSLCSDGIDDDKNNDDNVAARAVLAQGCGAVLATLGAAGCALWRASQPPLVLPGYAMKVADTIGAGDTFTGALAAALARGLPLREAARWANAAAALSVTGAGAIDGMPTLAATRAMLGG